MAKVIYRAAVMNESGEVVDHQRRPLATREELSVATDQTTQVESQVNSIEQRLLHPLDYNTLPSGTVVTLKKDGGEWPGVPTERTDIVFMWKGPDPSPPKVSQRTLGVSGFLDDVDIRFLVGE